MKADLGKSRRDALNHKVVIVGAGFSGLCLAARLVRSGNRDFVILEKGDTVGGTWRDNRYPGCACDIPSHLYSLSFGPHPRWSRRYPSQAELHAYLIAFADHFGLRSHIRFGAIFRNAEWEDSAARWNIGLADGVVVHGDVLVSAVGALHVPQKPHFNGMETFSGRVFHSSEWPVDFDAANRRIAVIGTGASAIQFIPQIAKTAASVTVFQRTAPWVLPKPDRPIGRIEQALFSYVSGYRRAVRSVLYWLHEARLLAFVGKRPAARLAQKLARRALEDAIPAGALRTAVTPQYAVGCKRTLLSNEYYQSLLWPNVSVETDGIDRFEDDRIISKTGDAIPIDTVIYGTGFEVVGSLMALDIKGSDGRRLCDVWENGPAAYLGISVPGFQNFFLMLGPNTGLGHNSQVVMIEAQADHIMRALEQMDCRQASTIEVDSDIHKLADQMVQQSLATTVWATGGCKSWYKNDNGRVVALWPQSTFRYRRLCKGPLDRAYIFGSGPIPRGT